MIWDETRQGAQSVPSWTNGDEIVFGPFTASANGDYPIQRGDTVYIWITKEGT